MQQRLIFLDVIRVIACMMVVLMHAPMTGEFAAAHGPFLVLDSYLTAPAVPLFFMVSGALLLPCREDLTAGIYLKKRIGKIIGPTLCFSLFYITLNISQLGGASLEVIRTIASIPFSAQGHGILWFMYTLTGLYLLVPIISPWIRRASKRELELYLILWLITLLYPYIGLAVKINSGDTGVLYYFTGYAGYFLLGHYLSKYPLSLKWLLPLAVLVLPLPLINKLMNWNLDFYSAFWYLSAPVAIMSAAWFVVIKAFVERIQIKDIISKALINVSNLSFGIYLIHIFIMRNLLWNWTFIQGISNYYIQTFSITILTFAGSLTICHLLSKWSFAQYIIGYSSHQKIK